jgi:formate dehydrogenase subunit gamma
MRLIVSAFLFCLQLNIALAAESSTEGLWRKIKQGQQGYTAVTGQESNILIQTTGTEWLSLRNDLIAGTGAWAIALTLLTLMIFYLIRGQVKLSTPREHVFIERWSRTERWLHWATAMLFVLLAITGFCLLYGRPVLISLLGHQVFSSFAYIAKVIHNYAGPLFIVGLLGMGLCWFKDNLPNKQDLAWFRQFGGMIGTQHPSADRMNAGEKAWFWLLMWAGLLISLSGLMLDFNNFGQLRLWLQISHVVHTLSAVLLMVGALGHIYIGTIGTEGALEGMVNGRVDVSWARQHHDLWYYKLHKNAEKAVKNGDK